MLNFKCNKYIYTCISLHCMELKNKYIHTYTSSHGFDVFMQGHLYIDTEEQG